MKNLALGLALNVALVCESTVPAGAQSNAQFTAFAAAADNYYSCKAMEHEASGQSASISAGVNPTESDLVSMAADAAVCVQDLIDDGQTAYVQFVPRKVLFQSCGLLKQHYPDTFPKACDHWFARNPG